MTAFGLASRLANPLPFGPPANYQGGIGEDLAELGYGLPAPEIRPARVPGDGHLIMPHVGTFQNIINLASRTYYMTYGEALKDSRENARVMRTDPIVMGAMRDRQVPIAQLPWHIEADDEADPYQKLMVDEMKKIVHCIPRFGNLRLSLLEAIWFGKNGVQTSFGWNYARGFKRMMVKDHIPVMGDKITMTFGGRVGILVHGAYQGPRVMTDLGMAHLLSVEEREQFILHQFEPEDADLFQGEFAGQRFGYGVRDRIYWWWWQRNIVTQWMMDFLQTIGVGGIMIYYYEEGNGESKAAAQEAANNQQSSNAILMPRRRNLQGGVDEVTQVDRIDASTAGAQLVYDVIVNYFNQAIRDYIMMERLTTRTGATGLGSNVATAHMDTAGDRKKYDATSLDETISRDLIWTIQRHTFPKCPPERSPLRFVSDVEQRDPVSVMTAAKMLMEMGGTVKEDQIRAAAGLDKPKDGDNILGGAQPQVPVQQDQNAITEPIQQLDGGRDRKAATRESWETKSGLNPEEEPVEHTEHSGSPIRLNRFAETESAQVAKIAAKSTNDAGRMYGDVPQLLGNGDGSGKGNNNCFAPTSPLAPIPIVHGKTQDLSQSQYRHVPDNLEGNLSSDPLVDSVPLPDDCASGLSEDELIPVQPPLPQGPYRFKRQPTEAQKHAGNYKKKHIKWKGFDVSIENVKGSIRSGIAKLGHVEVLRNAEFPAQSRHKNFPAHAVVVDRNSNYLPTFLAEDFILCEVSVSISGELVARSVQLESDHFLRICKVDIETPHGEIWNDNNTIGEKLLRKAALDGVRKPPFLSLLGDVFVPTIRSLGEGPHFVAFSPKSLFDGGRRTIDKSSDFSSAEAFVIKSVHLFGGDRQSPHVSNVRQLLQNGNFRARFSGIFVRQLVNPWAQKLTADYGYIRRTHSKADGDHIDIFVGPDRTLNSVFVVNQVDQKTGDFDEHKLVVGVPDAESAKALYMSNYEKGWKGFGSIAEMDVTGLKQWLDDGDTSEPAVGLIPAKRAADGSITLMDGTPAPAHIHPASVPQTWTDLLLSLNESSPIWMRAKEQGQKRVVYNPVLAPRFVRTMDAMQFLKDIPGSTILKMAIDNAVEPPFTRDDLLSALVTRMAARVKANAGEDGEDHVRRVSTAISKQVGVPAKMLVAEYISPTVWG